MTVPLFGLAIVLSFTCSTLLTIITFKRIKAGKSVCGIFIGVVTALWLLSIVLLLAYLYTPG